MKKLQVDPKAKALIFDLDGTIVDTMPVHLLAYQKVLGNFGIEFTKQNLDKMAGLPTKETMELIFEKHGVKADAAEEAKNKEDEYEKLMPSLKPVEIVLDVIKEYHGKLPMSVGTGGYRRLSKKSLELAGVSKYFDIVITNEDVKNFKPHPETFLRCAELMGVQPEYCQVFEDGRLGIEAAKTANMMWVDVTKI